MCLADYGPGVSRAVMWIVLVKTRGYFLVISHYFNTAASPGPVMFWTDKAPFWYTPVPPRPMEEPALFAPGSHPAGVPGRLGGTPPLDRAESPRGVIIKGYSARIPAVEKKKRSVVAVSCQPGSDAWGIVQGLVDASSAPPLQKPFTAALPPHSLSLSLSQGTILCQTSLARGELPWRLLMIAMIVKRCQVKSRITPQIHRSAS